MKFTKNKLYTFSDDTCQSLGDFLNGVNRRSTIKFKQKFVGMKGDKYLFEGKNGSLTQVYIYTWQGLKDWKVV